MKNNWLSNVKMSAYKCAGRTGFMIKKNSPEILLAVGIFGFVTTVVTACRATCKADEILEFHRKKIDDIHEAKELAEEDPENYEYDHKLYCQDLSIRYLKTTGSFVKLYGPSVAIGTLSVACILASRNIMQKRYLGVVAAYNGVVTVFDEYRKRVRYEYGEDMDRHFRYGTTLETEIVTEVDENGKKKKKEVQKSNTEMALVNPSDDTCRFFDSSNDNWDKNPQFSMMFLRGQQNILNDILHTRGHLFLNEVYDALGFDHTPQGAVLGWIDNGSGDGYVDFGLYDPNKDSVRRFVNGLDNVILLEFNHDGVILNEI